MVGTVAFLSGSSGRPKILQLVHALAVRLERLVVDEDAAAGRLTLARKHLHEFRLSVAGNAGDADDLARMDLQVHGVETGRPSSFCGENGGDIEHHGLLARLRLALGPGGDGGVADHHLRHRVMREVGDLARAGEPAAPQHGDGVGEGRHLAELVRDHEHGDFAALGHRAHEAKHLVRLAGREHGGRLVQDEKLLVEVELLENLELLLFSSRQMRDRHVERHAERHAVEELGKPLLLSGPVDHGGNVETGDDEVLRACQRGYQREVLVDHADTSGTRLARVPHRDLVTVHKHLPAIRLVEAHDALHEGGLTRAVLAEQRVKGAGWHLDRHVIQRDERAENLADRDRLQPDRA